MADNKVKFGLKNVHYSMLTYNTSGAAQFATPVPIPGAVNLTLDPEGDKTSFYADDVEYYVTNDNNGYSGTLEIARVPDQFRQDALGDVLDTNGILFEDQGAKLGHFALLFEFDGDQQATKHVIYNCTAGRTSESGSTKGESVEVQTESLSLTAKSVHFASVDKYIVKGKTTASTDSTAYSAWYTTVQQPTA